MLNIKYRKSKWPILAATLISAAVYIFIIVKNNSRNFTMPTYTEFIYTLFPVFFLWVILLFFFGLYFRHHQTLIPKDFLKKIWITFWSCIFLGVIIGRYWNEGLMILITNISLCILIILAGINWFVQIKLNSKKTLNSNYISHSEKIGFSLSIKKKYIFIPLIFSLYFLMAIQFSLIVSPLSSNCGGNTVTNMVCRNVVYDLGDEEDGKILSLSEVSPKTRANIQHSLDNHWLNNMDYRILKKSISKGGKTPVIICCKMYDNVPQPAPWNFYTKSPRYAVGYSDGSVGFITETEYNKLDLSNYDLVKQSSGK